MKGQTKQAFPQGSIPFHEGGENTPLSKRTVVHRFALPARGGHEAPFILATAKAAAVYSKAAQTTGMKVEHGEDTGDSVFDAMRDHAVQSLTQPATAAVVLRKADLLAMLQAVEHSDDDEAVTLEFIAVPDEIVRTLHVWNGKHNYLRSLQHVKHSAALRVVGADQSNRRCVLYGVPQIECTVYTDIHCKQEEAERKKKRHSSMANILKKAKAMLRAAEGVKHGTGKGKANADKKAKK